MRYALLAILLVGTLYADRLQTNATADTYIYDQRNVVSTAGSFSIRMASTDAMTRMDEANPTTNVGTATTGRLGLFNSTDNRWLLRWATLNDSMRTYHVAGKSIVWDSARVVLTITAAITAGDSLTVSMYTLKSNRAFVEAEATWNIYSTGNNWTTAGAASTTSDIDATQIDSSVTLLSTATSMSFKILTADITDTLNNAGFVLRYLRLGNDDGVTSVATIGADDNATASNRPLITVYFHEMEYPDFGGADTLLMKTTNPVTEKAYPVMTFDISSIPAGSVLDACSVFCYINANYSDNGEASLATEVGVAMKPIKIGTGTGTATATNKLHWASWSENGTTDSAWTTAGALDVGYVCNTNSGSGDDKTVNQAGSLTWSGTGWKGAKIDTAGVNAYWKNACRNFGVFLQPTAAVTDDAWYVLSSVEGANDPYLVIWYTPAATTPTKGTGRFGRAQNGAYLNVR